MTLKGNSDQQRNSAQIKGFKGPKVRLRSLSKAEISRKSEKFAETKTLQKLICPIGKHFQTKTF